MEEYKNVIMAIVFSLIIILGFQYFFSPTTPPPSKEQQQTKQQIDVTPKEGTIPESFLSRENALKGSLNLDGALLDDLILTKYHETIDPQSPEIVLLSPENTSQAYFTQFGWAGTQENLPTEKTLWQAHGDKLTPQTPVTLTWENGEGLTFSQVISIDENYMFTITQSLKNATQKAVSLAHHGVIAKRGEAKSSGFFILHLGPVGVFNGKLHDPSYEDL